MLYSRRTSWGWALIGFLAVGAFGLKAACGDWQEHQIRQGDGNGGWITLPAWKQVLKHPDANETMPFGLVQMDNGEIALMCSREKLQATGSKTFEPIIAFSQDGGATWSDFTIVPGTRGRPQLITFLGNGRLSFITEVFEKEGQVQRIYSNDYGRTWTETVDHPPTKAGHSFGVEGNAWVDRDEHGNAKTIFEVGWHYKPGKQFFLDDGTDVFRRSDDGGKTWVDEVEPPQWKFAVEHSGKSWLRGTTEGAVVRAANGDLVAALRTDMPPHFLDGPHDDSLEGTAVSISHDDGKTWSEMQLLFDAGRHHPNLSRLPNGDLVCTIVVRVDIKDGKLASHRRGCDALVSHDHGKTWNLDRRYELDRYDYLRDDGYWVDGKCGHVGAVALDDGHVISVYGNYREGAVLIKWKPVARRAESSDQSAGQVPSMPSRLLEQRDLGRHVATQGVAIGEDCVFTSTHRSICRFDANWALLEEKPIQIDGVNHLGAIDYHDGFVWAGLLNGPDGNGKHDPKLNRAVIAKIRASGLRVVQTWDITHDLTWIDPVCFDGTFLWVGDLGDLGIHRYQFVDDQLVRTGIFRYPKPMHFSQGIRVVGDKLYSIHTFGSWDGLFEFSIPENLTDAVNQPTRVWPIQETRMHLEGFDFVPDHPNEIWHAQGSQLDRYVLEGVD